MAVHVEVGLVGLTLGFEHKPGVLGKRNANIVRTGLHRNADVEIPVEQIIGGNVGRVSNPDYHPIRFYNE